MDEGQSLLALAAENLASAMDNLAHRPPRRAVAYAEARHALELACKVLLLHKTGTYRRDHKVGGDLFKAGLVPKGVDASRLSRLLAEFTRGEYGAVPVTDDEEVQEMIAMAQRLLEAASA